MTLRILTSLLLAGMTAIPLVAENYQTRFEQVRFDPAKGARTLHGDLEVEGSTGAVNMKIPLGPGIGARGANFGPAIVLRSSAIGWSKTEFNDPNLEMGAPPYLCMGPDGLFETTIVLINQMSTTTSYYASGGQGSFTPGSLQVNTTDPRIGTKLSSYLLPHGESGVIGGYAPAGVGTASLVLDAFGRGPTQGWQVAAYPYYTSPNGSQTPNNFIRIGSNGALVIGLRKDVVAPIMPVPDPGLESKTWNFPSCVLLIKGDVAYEYAFVGGVQDSIFLKFPRTANDASGKWKQWLLGSQYVLSRILNKFGDSIEFDYGFTYLGIQTAGTVPNGLDFTARWVRNGQPTGISVSFISQGQVNLTVPQPGVGGLPVTKAHSVKVTYSVPGAENAPSYSMSYFSSDMVTETTTSLPPLPPYPWPAVQAIYPVGSYSASCFPTSVTNLSNQESIQFTYTGGARFEVANTDAWPILSKVDYSSGKSISLYWDHFPYRPNAAGNAWAGYVEDLVRFDASAWGVVGITEFDAKTGSSIGTIHHRVTPVPIPNQYGWSSTKFYDEVTRSPNEASTSPGRTVVSYFVEPTLDGRACMQTLAHLNHKIRETREYPGSPGAGTDAGLPPEQSSAPIISIFDRWDTRGVGNPNGSFAEVGCEVYPTRTRSFDRESGILRVKEQTDWDANTYLWTKETQESYRPSSTFDLTVDFLSKALGAERPVTYQGTQQVITNTKVGEFDMGRWLGPRVNTESTNIQDSTPGLVGSNSFTPPPTARTFVQGTSLPKTILIGSSNSPQLMTTLTYKGESTQVPSDLPLIERAVVTDPSGMAHLSGLVGAVYTYDASFGFLKSVKPLGVAWEYRETRDGLGRVNDQTAPDGVKSEFHWDPSGRLTYQKTGTEVATTFDYPTPSSITATRQAQVTEFFFNGMGQLGLERRKDPGAGDSLRLTSFDQAGRVSASTVWLNQGNLLETGRANLVSNATYRTLNCTHSGSPGPVTLSNDPMPYDPRDGSTCSICQAEFGLEERLALHKGTRTDYDWRGRVTKTIDPNGLTISQQYGTWAQGLQVIRTVMGAEVGGITKNLQTILGYDALGRLVDLVDAKGRRTTYGYDAAGRIARVQQYGENQATEQPARTWSYDGLGRLTEIFQPESGITKYEDFDVAGKPWKTTYAPSSSTPKILNSVYDTVGNLTSMTSVSGPVNLQFTFDPGPNDGTPSRGKLVHASSTNSQSGNVQRDLEYTGVNGRLSLIKVTIPGANPFVQKIGYDPTYGYLSTRTYTENKDQTLHYDYSKGLPDGVTFPGMSAMTMAYDPIHRSLSALTVTGGSTSYFNYGFDQARLKSMQHVGLNGSTIASWLYDYDAAGRLRSDGVDFYRQDELGRLVQAFVKDHPSGASPSLGIFQTYDYDAYGNRTNLHSWKVHDWVPGSLPPLNPSLIDPLPGNRALSYDMNQTEKAAMAATNRLPSSMGGVSTGVGLNGYDAQGNLLEIQRLPGSSTEAMDSLIRMEYDALGRVTSMWDKQRNVVEAYAYDDQGLRVLVETYQGTVAPSNLMKKQYRIYNEARQLVSEYELVLE